MSRRSAALLGIAALLLMLGGVAAASLAGREYVLSAFTTDLQYRSAAQRANVEIALQRLDGVVLVPGAELSFNETVGERVLQAGYEKAPVMGLDGISETPGGGICQLSSTVYNAALMAGLRITERWPHMRTVRSVGPGRDATVLYGCWDLRFTNPYSFAVRIRPRVTGNRLIVQVMGPRPLPTPVTVRVERVGGTSVRTWRRVGVVEELVSEDRYLPWSANSSWPHS